MVNTRLATRYAKSILDLSIEKGLLEKVFADMEWLQAITKSNRDFTNMLRSPIIKPDIKNRILEALTKGKVSELTAGFIRLLVNKGRESNLPEITSAFVTQYKQNKNIHTVRLTTAIPATEELKKSIVNHIKSTTEIQNIELETVVDEKIIGGFVLHTGDKLVDASIAYDLKAIAKQFENNDFIYKLR